MARITDFYLIILSVIAYGCAIPAVLWKSEADEPFPVYLAGHTLTADQFYNGYLQVLTLNPERNTVVFVQDQLSSDDITRYADVFNDVSDGAAFSSLRKIMEDYDSTYLSNVMEPMSAIEKSKSIFKGNVIETIGAETLDLDPSRANFIIVELPKTSSGGRLETLAKSDKVIAQVMKMLRNIGKPFAAVYTARATSQSLAHQLFSGRHLLQTAENNTDFTFFNLTNSSRSCFYMYFSKLELKVGETPPYAIVNGGFNTESWKRPESTCSAESAVLSIAVPAASLPSGLTAFSLNMTFSTQMSYWQLDTASVIYTEEGTAKSAELTPFYVYGTIGRAPSSYHCTDGEPMRQKGGDAQLKFSDWQLQLGIQNDAFARANDCVGFFSEGIWMGLVTSLVLILILTFGLVMLANINTMDRFDDPKGKTIQVNVAE